MLLIDRFRETEVGKRGCGVSSHGVPLTSDDFLNRVGND